MTFKLDEQKNVIRFDHPGYFTGGNWAETCVKDLMYLIDTYRVKDVPLDHDEMLERLLAIEVAMITGKPPINPIIELGR